MTQHDKNQFYKMFFSRGAIFRRAESEWVLWAWKPTAQVLDPFRGMGYQLFFGGQFQFIEPVVQPRHLSTQELYQELKDFAVSIEAPRANISKKDFTITSKELFSQLMQTVQRSIHRGEIDKAVPVVHAQTEKLPLLGNLMDWIYQLSQCPEQLFVYGLWGEDFGVIGATPEFLFYRKGALLQSMALAGTCPRSDLGTRLPLLKDPKELHEHRLVIEDLKTKLNSWGPLKIHETQVLELPSLLHLKTLISCEVSGRAVVESQLIQKLHPTAALGVYPSAYGYGWMETLPEQMDRYLFGSPLLFPLAEDESICLVAIRNIQWNKSGTRVTSGCGIVADSTLEREWNELENKRQAVWKLLGIE